MTDNPYLEHVKTALSAAGLSNAELEREEHFSGFGDMLLVFRIGSVLLRIVRDRGQDFLEIGSVSVPNLFWNHFLVEIAMGWTTVDAVLSRSEVEQLSEVLCRVGEGLNAVQIAFSNERVSGTRNKLDWAKEKVVEARKVRDSSPR